MSYIYIYQGLNISELIIKLIYKKLKISQKYNKFLNIYII